jgi:hypothetical protein
MNKTVLAILATNLIASAFVGCTADVEGSLVESSPPSVGEKAAGSADAPFVQIQFSAFIPCSVVGPGAVGRFASDWANLYFSGDGRGFDFNAPLSQNRAAILTNVTKGRVAAQSNFMATSHQWSHDNLVEESAEWSPFAQCFRPASGGQPLFEYTDPSPTLKVFHRTIETGDGWTKTKTHLQIHATGQSINGPLPASLDGEADVYIRWNNNTQMPIDYWVETTHDGFPAYEIYINGSTIHTHDPRTTGRSPIDLSPIPGGRISDSLGGTFSTN